MVDSLRKPVEFKKHAIALLITVLIFTIGILIGIRLSDERLAYTQEVIEKQKLDYQSLQLQLLSLTQQNKNCDFVLHTLEKNIYDLEEARIKLENYIEGTDNGNFNLIKRDYMLTEIRYWLMTQQARELCGGDTVNILYFYQQDNECGDCSAQGHILTYLKDQLKDKLLIFSLDYNSDEPMVQLLKQTYNIQHTPSLVIENHTVQGLTTKETLITTLCTYYTSPVEVCDNAL